MKPFMMSHFMAGCLENLLHLKGELIHRHRFVLPSVHHSFCHIFLSREYFEKYERNLDNLAIQLKASDVKWRPLVFTLSSTEADYFSGEYLPKILRRSHIKFTYWCSKINKPRTVSLPLVLAELSPFSVSVLCPKKPAYNYRMTLA